MFPLAFRRRVADEIGSGTEKKTAGPRMAGMALLAAGLALAMALVSAPNAHPDEVFHVRAAEYYLAHWLPPEIGSPAIRDSYSVYGWSYLNTPDAAYFAAGLFGRLVVPLVGDPFLAFRLFNVALFAGLAAMFWRIRDARPLLVGLLLTPQVWYVFSSFNNDGFALFLGFALCYLLVVRFEAAAFPVAAETWPWHWTTLVAGACAGLMLISKTNYLVIPGFVVVYVLMRDFGLAAAAGGVLGGTALANQFVFYFGLPPWLAWSMLVAGGGLLAWGVTGIAGTRNGVLVTIARYGMITGVALLVVAPVKILDRQINGDPVARSAKEASIQAEMAAAEFSLGNKDATGPYGGLGLRKQGLTFRDIFLPPWSWPVWTTLSIVGVYGYMNIYGPKLYYVAIWIVLLALLTHGGWTAMRAAVTARDWREPGNLALAAGSCCVVVVAAAYASWVWDFQPQGRYLFPLLPILGAMAWRYGSQLQPRAVNSLVLAAYTLSLYSFVFVGLWRIPKVF